MTFDIKKFAKAIGGEASLASEGRSSAEFSSFIDTGSLTFNAALSGSVHGGWPDNKVLVLAGEQATGKTYFALGIISHFLASRPGAIAIIYDTEAAITRAMLEERGIDPSRVIVVEPLTVQEFKTRVVNFVELYTRTPEAERPPCIMLLDSLGALSTTKEMQDTESGNDVKDMTRQQVIRAAFRTARLKLAKARIPMLVTNHTYAGIGQYATRDMCMTGESEVLLADGTAARIDSVRVGDEVATLEGPARVTGTFASEGEEEVFEVRFEDGTKIECTGDHMLMVDREWVRVSDLVEAEGVINTQSGGIADCTTTSTESRGSTRSLEDTTTA